MFAAQAFAQTAVKAYAADLAVPFGVASGQIIVVGDYLVFVDAEKPETSIGAMRSELRVVSAAPGEELTVETAASLTDRSGPRTRFVFRLKNPGGAEAIQSWYRSRPMDAAKPATSSAEKPPAALAPTYQVTHKHRIGSCSGRVILEDGRVVFESITNVEHSRRWQLSEIKELKRSNPYSLKVIPFAGGDYDFSVLEKGMESTDFSALVDRVTRARSK
jgi:hypothetical protein